MDGIEPVGHAPRRAQRLRWPGLDSQWTAALLLGAVSVALLAQGAYYPRTQLWVAVLLTTALLTLPASGRVAGGDRAVTFPALGLAAWAVIDGALHSQPRTGIAYLTLLAGMLAVFVGCGQLDAAARDLVLTGLTGCGVLLALIGWLGLALHLSRWTWQGQGLWRASSTLTYPNATAALLAMFALVLLARLTETPRSIPLVLSATGLLTGLIATLSRAGLLGLAMGVLVLAAMRGSRALARASWGPMLGAAVAALGVVPTMTSDGPRPVPAAIGLAAGLALATGAAMLRWSRCAVGGLALVALALALVLRRPSWAGVTAITDARLTPADPERAASFAAALRVFGAHRLIGAGPSLPTLTWTSGTGSSVYRYAHNEYLQVLAELGVVGGLLLATLLASVLRWLWQRRRVGGAMSAGALAAMTALAVHAGFDFVWHIPAIPLVAGALVGLASPDQGPVSNTQQTGETSRKEYR